MDGVDVAEDLFCRLVVSFRFLLFTFFGIATMSSIISAFLQYCTPADGLAMRLR